MMKSIISVAFVALLGFSQIASTQNLNFAYESNQLTEQEVLTNSALSFGDVEAAKQAFQQEIETDTLWGPRCKVQPGDLNWPSLQEWDAFNKSLGGVLLKPTPPGAACYPSTTEYDEKQCEFLVTGANTTRFWIDDPLGIFTQWAQGNSCPAVKNPVGECTRGGSPVYVVDARTVKHVQMAINFARNKNIRLVIK
jgi:hypothetical protein